MGRILESMICPFNGNEFDQLILSECFAFAERHNFIRSPMQDQNIISKVQIIPLSFLRSPPPLMAVWVPCGMPTNIWT